MSKDVQKANGKFDFVNCLRCTSLYNSCLAIQHEQISQEHVLSSTEENLLEQCGFIQLIFKAF